jgi:predicted O-methyltransferase YrrM
VDLRPDPSIQLSGKLSKNTELSIGDSVEFLQSLYDNKESVDLIYLDSYDVNWENPEPAELHGEAEFKIAMELARVGGIILIDDTPTPGAASRVGIRMSDAVLGGSPSIRGKGAKALQLVEANPNFSILYHDYAVAIRRNY